MRRRCCAASLSTGGSGDGQTRASASGPRSRWVRGGWVLSKPPSSHSHPAFLTLTPRCIPHTPQADEIGPDSDPYICFRRREVKLLRKARRSDNHSIEKLKRLREELLRAREILELVAARETTRKELLEVEGRIFDQRIKIRRIKKKFGIAHVEASKAPAAPGRAASVASASGARKHKRAADR